MSPEVAEALEKSIEHWEQNAAARDVDFVYVGRTSCPLCMMFNKEDRGLNSCAGCPVKDRSGEVFCRKTPFMNAQDARRHWEYEPDNSLYARDFRKAAQAEVDFLKSLREVPQ